MTPLRTSGTLALAALLALTACGPSDPHAGHDHGATAESSAPAEPSLQALQNLGVKVRSVKTKDFVRTVRVQAEVRDAPLNERDVTAPLGGIVTALHVRPGQVVAPGDPLVTISRDSIPRSELPHTGALVPAATENLHAATSRYRTAVKQLAITRAEIARLQEFAKKGVDASGLPVVPRQTLIDLEYDRQRAELERDDAGLELARHGISAEERDELLKGGRPPSIRRLWKRTLEASGYWGPSQDAVLETLPLPVARLPWVVGALGELAACGHDGEDLAQAVKESPPLRKRFPEAVSLLLQGHTVERVRWLAEQGALDASMVVRAPAGAPDWDVDTISVRPGARVDEGAAVAGLHDARTMWLVLSPVGRELSLVTRALASGSALSARPLVPGSGPALQGLRLARIAAAEAGGAYATCPNTAIARPEGEGFRSWALRAGLRYLVDVPAEQFPASFVLPAGGITSDGVETIVYVRHGGHFDPQPVRVLYRDDDVAVVADDGSLSEGDKVAVEGAFALGMALQSGKQGVDPHAGHSHD